MTDDHPRSIEGIADEEEAELRRLVEERGPEWSVLVDPEAGGGCFVEIRRHGAVVWKWWDRRRLEAVSTALTALYRGELDK